jgi:hypothetical protein
VRVFVNGVLRRIVRPKRDAVISAPIRVIKYGSKVWLVFTTNGRSGAYRVLVGKLEGKTPLDRPRHR